MTRRRDKLSCGRRRHRRVASRRSLLVLAEGKGRGRERELEEIGEAREDLSAKRSPPQQPGERVLQGPGYSATLARVADATIAPAALRRQPWPRCFYHLRRTPYRAASAPESPNPAVLCCPLPARTRHAAFEVFLPRQGHPSCRIDYEDLRNEDIRTSEYTEAKVNLKMEDVSGVVDWNVDIIGPDGGGSSSKLAKIEDPDATECSSSFGDTLSGSEDDTRPLEISDIEVDSPFCRYHPNGDAAALLDAAAADNLDRSLKKKKVTDHWRTYISPLMWRCQWLELRMKELHSQVSRYDRELAVLKHEKELQTKMIELDCSSSRSVPFSSLCCRKTMKRRRRKRTEEKMNASSYIATHTILSYYEKEKAEADGHSIDDNGILADDSTKGNNDADWLLGNGSDATVEQILASIQSVQDRVFSLRSYLKTEIDKKSNGLDLKVNTRVNVVQSSNCSHGKGKVAEMLEISSRDASDCDMDDTDMPDSAVSSFGEANNMDIFESTMNLLSAEDPHKMGELQQSSEDVLIDNQPAEEGYQNFEVISHPCKHLRVSVKSEAGVVKRETGAHSEDESIAAPTVAIVKKEEPPEDGTARFGLQGILKPCYTGKRKGRKQKILRRGGSSSSALSSWRSAWTRKKRKL